MSRIRAAILISGRGSNMMALIEAARQPDYPAEIACVIADRPGAAGLHRATAAGIDTALVDRAAHPTRADFEAALDSRLRAKAVELVVLAGFMRLLSPEFTGRWQGRLINIHPSLLPAYKGLDTHARVLADAGRRHGCTVHQVTADLDSGPIILQAEVEVLDGDTPDSLAARVLEHEHRIFPQALAMVARGLQQKTSI